MADDDPSPEGFGPQGEQSRIALKMPVPKAPWSAVRQLTDRLCARGSKAFRHGGPHSKARRAFSWFLGARQPTGMTDCLENTQSEIPPRRSSDPAIRHWPDLVTDGLTDRNDGLESVITQTPAEMGMVPTWARVLGPPTAYCLPPTAHCPLPTAYCLLPACLLPTCP